MCLIGFGHPSIVAPVSTSLSETTNNRNTNPHASIKNPPLASTRLDSTRIGSKGIEGPAEGAAERLGGAEAVAAEDVAPGAGARHRRRGPRGHAMEGLVFVRSVGKLLEVWRPGFWWV